MKIIKKNYQFILLFFFFLLVLILFGNVDIIWNYGFSHAIRMGEIPYKDFNIISTPLYSYILSIGLFIKDTYFVFLLEQAFVSTLFIYLLKKLLGNNYLLILIVFCFPIYTLLFPSYNFFCLFLITLLLYLEKEKKPDSLIGITLGCLVLSKHTIGIFILFLSLLSTHQRKKALKRLLFSLIPLTVFLIILMVTNSIYSFINLSIMGMIDFGSKNSTLSLFTFFSLFCILIYILYSIFKNKNNIYNYYLLGGISFIIPICDLTHIVYFSCLFLIVFFLNHEKVLELKQLKLICAIFMVLIFLINVFYNYNTISNFSNNKLKKFHASILDEERISYVQSVLKKYNSYDNSYMISMSSMFFDIESNHNITYFDVPLYGNFGYNGIKSMKKKIDNCHNCYFFLTDSNNRQFAVELNDYIRNKYKYIDTIENFKIYKIE